MHRRRELLPVLHEAREVVMARRISMQRAAAYWAKVTGAPRPHRGTLVRWATRGVRGRRLRAELLGGRWFTSEAEVDEFLRHVTQVALEAGERVVTSGQNKLFRGVKVLTGTAP